MRHGEGRNKRALIFGKDGYPVSLSPTARPRSLESSTIVPLLGTRTCFRRCRETLKLLIAPPLPASRQTAVHAPQAPCSEKYNILAFSPEAVSRPPADGGTVSLRHNVLPVATFHVR